MINPTIVEFMTNEQLREYYALLLEEFHLLDSHLKELRFELESRGETT